MKINGQTTLKRTGLNLGLAVALGSLASFAAAESVMKIAHVVPAGDPRDIAANYVADYMNSSAMCEMEAEVFPSAQLGGTTDLIEGMQIGSIESVVLPASFLVGFQPMMGLFDFPFFWPSDLDTLLEVHNSDSMKELLATTESQGIYSKAVWHTGYKQWTANSALRNPDDYRGIRARVMPSDILITQQESLGMTPVDMPFPETYNALQSGAISAQENPIPTTFVMGFHEVQDYMIMTNHGNLDQIFMVSKAWFDGLSDACQTELDKAIDDGKQVVVDETKDLESRGMQAIRAQGTTIVELSDAEVTALRDATLPAVRARFIEITGNEGEAMLELIESELEL